MDCDSCGATDIDRTDMDGMPCCAECETKGLRDELEHIGKTLLDAGLAYSQKSEGLQALIECHKTQVKNMNDEILRLMGVNSELRDSEAIRKKERMIHREFVMRAQDHAVRLMEDNEKLRNTPPGVAPEWYVERVNRLDAKITKLETENKRMECMLGEVMKRACEECSKEGKPGCKDPRHCLNAWCVVHKEAMR